jgi:hypothetical protein
LFYRLQLLASVIVSATMVHHNWQQERCTACDRRGCKANSRLCPYFGRGRPAHIDASRGDNVPHFAQIEVEQVGLGLYKINGRLRRQGFACGINNNCLIHTLAAVCDSSPHNLCPDGCEDAASVRASLQLSFPSKGDQEVTQDNFLTLDHHWRHILKGLLRVDLATVEARFRVICIDVRRGGDLAHGDAVGSGPIRLYIARTHNNHFVPLHPHKQVVKGVAPQARKVVKKRKLTRLPSTVKGNLKTECTVPFYFVNADELNDHPRWCYCTACREKSF